MHYMEKSMGYFPFLMTHKQGFSMSVSEKSNVLLIKISRTLDRKPRPVQDMGIDHGGGHIRMA